MIDTKAIRKRLEAATPGPWRVETVGELQGHILAKRFGDGPSDEVSLGWLERDEDNEFIAHAPADIVGLLAEVERLRAEIGAAKTIARGELATELELRMALLALPDDLKKGE